MMKKEWPKDYYCAERTLDIELPWGGVTARVWIDGNSTHWTNEKLIELAQSVRRVEEWRQTEPQRLLNWLAALPDVNAVQVFRTYPNGIKVGVMGYTVPFDDRQGPVYFKVQEPDLSGLQEAIERIP